MNISVVNCPLRPQVPHTPGTDPPADVRHLCAPDGARSGRLTKLKVQTNVQTSESAGRATYSCPARRLWPAARARLSPPGAHRRHADGIPAWTIAGAVSADCGSNGVSGPDGRMCGSARKVRDDRSTVRHDSMRVIRPTIDYPQIAPFLLCSFYTIRTASHHYDLYQHIRCD